MKDQRPASTTFKSSLKFAKDDGLGNSNPIFFPPEAFGGDFTTDSLGQEIDLENASAWDVATRYHEFKSKRGSSDLAKKLRKLSADVILEKAQAVLGSVVHPVQQRLAPIPEVPPEAIQPDFDFDETLEHSALQLGTDQVPVTEADLWMSYSVRRQQALVLSVDTSLSMTGEKLALTAVALAVVLLEFPDDPIGIIAFENEAKVLKYPEERISIPLLVERFLDVPAQGYTHLEDGMIGALHLVRQAQRLGQGKPPSTVLLTDGKYTAGKDPAYLASRFPHLVVLKMGREIASLELCRELAKKGKGVMKEVEDLSSLPTIMYGVVKDLLRGGGK